MSLSFLRGTPSSSLTSIIVINRNEYSVSESLIEAECFRKSNRLAGLDLQFLDGIDDDFLQKES